MDVRCFAFVVARALVAEIDKLCKTSPNGELQTNDMLHFFTASGNVSGSQIFALPWHFGQCHHHYHHHHHNH